MQRNSGHPCSYPAIGRLLGEMRRARGITQEAVAEKLVAQRTVSNLEQNGDMPDPLVFDVLMRRLGASTQFFMTMLTQREYEYLCWKESVLEKIREGSIRLKDWDCEMARSRQIHKELQAQFAEFWRGYLEGNAGLMDQAIARTVAGYPGPLSDSQCLSSEEILYILLCMEKRLSGCPGQWQSVKELLVSILRYIESNYIEEEQVKVYGKAACLFGTYMQDAGGEEKAEYYKKVLALLRRQAALNGMCEILRGLLGERDVLEAEECKEYENGLYALEWVKQEFQVEEQALACGEWNQEYCLLHEVLGAYRRERGLRIRDINGNACSGKAYRALEEGKRDAKKGTYYSLADYMGIPLGVYNAEIISDSYEDYVLVGRIQRLLNEQRNESALLKLAELERRLGDKAGLKKNEQFITSIRDILLFEKGELTLEEYHMRVMRTIRLTIPGWDLNYGEHFYTQREMILVYNLARVYRRMRDYDTAIGLLRGLWDQLERSSVAITHRVHEALLINTLWKDLLTDVKRYEEALERVKIGMDLSFMSGIGNYLDVLTFEPEWIMNVREEELSEDEKIKCTAYFQCAYYISKLFYRKDSQKRIRKYCGENGIELFT